MMARGLRIHALGFFGLCCMFVLVLSCSQEAELTAEEQAEQTFMKAYNALQNHDIELYMDALDYSVEMDSFQLSIIQSTLLQHQDWQEKVHGIVNDVDVVNVELHDDSTCTLFYHIVYSDSTEMTSSQFMVRNDGVWKLRVRN